MATEAGALLRRWIAMRHAAGLLVLVLAAGCGASTPPAAQPPAPSEPKRSVVRHARCPAQAANCAAVTGRVIYVEAIDPDGDGDAHYVLAGGRVTAPGMTAVDVGRKLRPRRLPRIGEMVSAAGPVFTGSHGQRQIEAVEIHHQPR